MGKSIAEEIVYRQSLMKHPAKEGQSRRLHSHPNLHTEAELKRIWKYATAART